MTLRKFTSVVLYYSAPTTSEDRSLLWSLMHEAMPRHCYRRELLMHIIIQHSVRLEGISISARELTRVRYWRSVPEEKVAAGLEALCYEGHLLRSERPASPSEECRY